MEKSTRSILLDFMKGIGCLFVVLVHFPFPGAAGRIASSIGVSTVVLFFLISGYFAYDKDGNNQKLILRIKRNTFILLCSIIFYIIFAAVRHIYLGSFAEWTSALKSPVVWIRFFILGDFELFYADPLWFMPALIYAYIIILAVNKFKLFKLAYCALPFLLLLRIGMETYTNTMSVDWHLSGNFMVGALPVMLLGHFIASKKEKIASLNVRNILLFALTGTAFTFISTGFAWKIDISQIGKIWMATSFFILALRKPDLSVSKVVEYIGTNLSLYIYLLHFALGLIISDCFKHFCLSDGYFNYLLPISAIAVSCMVSLLIYNRPKKLFSRRVLK